MACNPATHQVWRRKAHHCALRSEVQRAPKNRGHAKHLVFLHTWYLSTPIPSTVPEIQGAISELQTMCEISWTTND